MNCWGTLSSRYSSPSSSPPRSGEGRYRLSFPYRNPQETIDYSFLFFKLQLISPSVARNLPTSVSCRALENNKLTSMAHRIDCHPRHSISASHPAFWLSRWGPCLFRKRLFALMYRQKEATHMVCVTREWVTADAIPHKCATIPTAKLTLYVVLYVCLYSGTGGLKYDHRPVL